MPRLSVAVLSAFFFLVACESTQKTEHKPDEPTPQPAPVKPDPAAEQRKADLQEARAAHSAGTLAGMFDSNRPRAWHLLGLLWDDMGLSAGLELQDTLQAAAAKPDVTLEFLAWLAPRSPDRTALEYFQRLCPRSDESRLFFEHAFEFALCFGQIRFMKEEDNKSHADDWVRRARVGLYTLAAHHTDLHSAFEAFVAASIRNEHDRLVGAGQRGEALWNIWLSSLGEASIGEFPSAKLHFDWLPRWQREKVEEQYIVNRGYNLAETLKQEIKASAWEAQPARFQYFAWTRYVDRMQKLLATCPQRTAKVNEYVKRCVDHCAPISRPEALAQLIARQGEIEPVSKTVIRAALSAAQLDAVDKAAASALALQELGRSWLDELRQKLAEKPDVTEGSLTRYRAIDGVHRARESGQAYVHIGLVQGFITRTEGIARFGNEQDSALLAELKSGALEAFWLRHGLDALIELANTSNPRLFAEHFSPWLPEDQRTKAIEAISEFTLIKGPKGHPVYLYGSFSEITVQQCVDKWITYLRQETRNDQRNGKGVPAHVLRVRWLAYHEQISFLHRTGFKEIMAYFYRLVHGYVPGTTYNAIFLGHYADEAVKAARIAPITVNITKQLPDGFASGTFTLTGPGAVSRDTKNRLIWTIRANGEGMIEGEYELFATAVREWTDSVGNKNREVIGTIEKGFKFKLPPRVGNTEMRLTFNRTTNQIELTNLHLVE